MAVDGKRGGAHWASGGARGGGGRGTVSGPLQRAPPMAIMAGAAALDDRCCCSCCCCCCLIMQRPWGGEEKGPPRQKKEGGGANVEKRERLRKGTAFAGARTKHLQFAPLVPPPFRMQAALLEEGGEAAASHTLTDEECVRGRRR